MVNAFGIHKQALKFNIPLK